MQIRNEEFVAMKVLSIDYDYFQKVSIETIKKHYPDGVDLPTKITEITWSSHYANPYSAKPLKAVEVNWEELETMQDILDNQRTDLPVLITNSHVHIYDFIHEHCKTEKLFLTNVDMHHDMFNDNPKLDCGNWIKHIQNDYGEENVGLRWISNPISCEVFGFGENERNMECKGQKVFPTSVSDISDIQFDLVFLCRSDTWTPPHLDVGFEVLVETCVEHFDKVLIEESVKTPRDIRELVKQQKEFYSSIINKE